MENQTIESNLLCITLVVSLCLGFAYTQAWQIRTDQPGYDYNCYIEASRSIVHGFSPYVEGHYYVYPPPLAVLLIPLSFLGHFEGYWLWTIIGVVGYGYSAYRSGRYGHLS